MLCYIAYSVACAVLATIDDKRRCQWRTKRDTQLHTTNVRSMLGFSDRGVGLLNVELMILELDCRKEEVDIVSSSRSYQRPKALLPLT